MEQCALTFLGTIAFCLCTVFISFSRAHGCFRDLLLDFSRLLGLTLRPFAPVFRCHREMFATLEAGTCAGSRAWYFFVFSLVFWDGDVLKRILTASEEFLSKVADSGGYVFLRQTFFSHITLSIAANNVHSFLSSIKKFGLRLDTLKRDYLLVLSPHRTRKFYTMLHSPESPHGYVENDSFSLPGQ